MLELIITIFWILPFAIIAILLYRDLHEGDSLSDYDWGLALLSAIPFVGFINIMIVFLITVADSDLWAKIKNIKIK